MTHDPPQHPFSADRPIVSRDDDLLGTSVFSKALALSIKGWQGRDSLVLALYGPWGSGKSSIKNMILESLRENTIQSPQIVEFNPWQWSGQNEIAHAFFTEVGHAIGRVDNSSAGRKRATKWRAYAAYLKAGSFAVGGLRKLVIAVFAILATFTAASWLTDRPWVRLLIFGIALAAFILTGLLNWSGDFLEKVAVALQARAEVGNKDLSEIKKELSRFLGELGTPVVIVIDDVDRLSADEVKLLFQLVKANADFPNLIYLLLFQRDIIEKSLETAFGPIDGRDFLEKIVQVAFDTPRIDRMKLEKVLFSGLDQCLADEAVGKRFDKQRWGNIFIAGLRPFFENLRDVRRFLGTLDFHIGLFKSSGSFNVNPIDLIGIEVLRVFEPAVYNLLPQYKAALTESPQDPLSTEKDKEETKRQIEAIVSAAPSAHRVHVRETLKQLFPYTSSMLGGVALGVGPEDRLFRELRVSHPDVFDRYFQFTIPEGDISQTEIDQVLSLTGNRSELARKLRDLRARGLLGVLLDRLEDYKQEIDVKDAIPFITALYDVGDELPDEPKGFFSIATDMHACRIIYWYLKKERDPQRPAQIIKEAMCATDGVYLPVMHTSLESSERDQKAATGSNMVGDEDLKELQEICVERIRQAARDGRLRSHSKLPYLLYRWREWYSPKEPSNWVADLIQTDEGLLSFLTSLLQKRRGFEAGDYVTHESWSMSLKTVEDFVPLDALAGRVAQLPLEKLSEKQRTAIDAFKRALKRRQDGKGDDSWHDDE